MHVRRVYYVSSHLTRYWICGRDISVGVSARLRVVQVRNRGSIPIVSKRLFSSPKRQDRLPVQCVQGVKGPGREDDHATVVRS